MFSAAAAELTSVSVRLTAAERETEGNILSLFQCFSGFLFLKLIEYIRVICCQRNGERAEDEE